MPLRERQRTADGGVTGMHEAEAEHAPGDGAGADARRFAEQVEAAVARTPATVAASWRRLLATESGAEPESRELIGLLAGQGGGKYLRARLAAAAYLGFGGDDPDVCDALGAAVQLLHAGLCIHDDLIDGDDHRHGRPNVIGAVRSARLAAGSRRAAADRQASAAALLAGDLAIGASLRSLARAPVEAAMRSTLVLELLAALDDTILGELLDVTGEEARPADARPIRTAELKTAGYSVVLPLRLGAVASGRAADAAVEALTGYGRHLGVAYQLKDDELAVFGDPRRTGKSASSDIRGGKRTRLLQLALETATPDERRMLERDVGRADLSDAGVERVRAVMRESGALEEHRGLIVRHAAAAVAALRAVGVPEGLDAYLQVIARAVPGRRA